MITSIFLDQENQSNYKTTHHTEKVLVGLKKINIFIGANNSGKSRFLRSLFHRKEIGVTLNDYDPYQLNVLKKQVLELIDSILPESRALNLNLNPVKAAINKLNPLEFINWKNNHANQISKIDGTIQSAFASIQNLNVQTHRKIELQSRLAILNAFNEHVSNINEAENIYIFNTIFNYIPILRGLRPIQLNSNNTFDQKIDNYKKRTDKDYFDNTTDLTRSIFTGLELYDNTRKLLLGKTEDRKKINDFERFLSTTFFQNQETNLVPNHEDDSLHIRIGEIEYPIYKLGDGIQAIICLMYPIYFNRDKTSIFFIEEPETHLHPGLIRIFIETLEREEFKNHQFFLTTHSNHLLDLTSNYENISVYKFSGVPEVSPKNFEIEKSNPSDPNLLTIIGARPSSVFLSNCSIWIEGITDRIYIQRFLELIFDNKGQQFKQDYHYSFIEYSGNNITHWSFLDPKDGGISPIEVKKICSKFFLITDQDGAMAGSAKSNRHEELQKKLGSHYCCLPVREIENILTNKCIVSVIKELENKNSNTIDFSDFENSDIRNEKIGDLITNKIGNLRRKYASESGSLNNKLEFAKIAVSHISSFDELSKEAKDLSSRLFEFIAKANK